MPQDGMSHFSFVGVHLLACLKPPGQMPGGQYFRIRCPRRDCMSQGAVAVSDP